MATAAEIQADIDQAIAAAQAMREQARRDRILRQAQGEYDAARTWTSMSDPREAAIEDLRASRSFANSDYMSGLQDAPLTGMTGSVGATGDAAREVLGSGLDYMNDPNAVIAATANYLYDQGVPLGQISTIIDTGMWTPYGSVVGGADVATYAPEAYRAAREGDWSTAAGNAAVAGLGLFDAVTSFAPLVGSTVRTGRRAIDTGSDIAHEALNTARAKHYIDPNIVYNTYEAQPYANISTGKRPSDWFADPRQHLPNASSMTPEERAAFAADPRRSWIDPATGGDIMYRDVGASTLPTLQGAGMYDGPAGVETNPLFIARSHASSPQSDAVAALRGYIDAQGATPTTQLGVGDQNALFIPHAAGAGSASDLERLQAAGKDFGLTDVWDVGEGYVMTGFKDPQTGRSVRQAIGDVGVGRPISTTMQSSYPAYEGAWEGGALPATERLLGYLDAADPAAVQALQSSPDVARIAGNIRAADNQLGGYKGVNNDVQAYRNMIARNDWLDPMRADVANKQAIQMQQPVPVLTAGDPLQVHHYSENPLDVIDPNYQFTNAPMRGTERELPRPYPAQSYFGTEGYVKESNLGDVLHGAELQGPMLDLGGPQADAYRAEAQKIVDMYGTQTNLSDTMRNNLATSLTMEMARQAGYTGLQNPTRNIATSFYPTETAWKRLTGE